MRATTPVQSVSRFATRQIAFAVIIVIFAMGALALLAEALNSGGGTVYLAEIQPSSGGSAAGPSLVVAGYGSASVPAEFATMQLLITTIENGYGGPFPSSTSEDDATATPVSVEERVSGPIVDAMIAAGAPADGITLIASESFMASPYGNPDAVGFRLDVIIPTPDLATVAAVLNAAGQAASDDGYRMVQSGVAYGISDCGPLRQTAWENALADARRQATIQADLLGIEIGDLLYSNETARSDPQAAMDASTAFGRCAVAGVSTAFDLYGQITTGVSVPRFDPTTEPVATAYTSLTLGFEIKN